MSWPADLHAWPAVVGRCRPRDVGLQPDPCRLGLYQREQGRARPLLLQAANDDFAGMIQIMKNYVATRGAFLDNLLTDESQVPLRPTINYTGQAGFPADALSFSNSAFTSPGGASTFAALEWRDGRNQRSEQSALRSKLATELRNHADLAKRPIDDVHAIDGSPRRQPARRARVIACACGIKTPPAAGATGRSR